MHELNWIVTTAKYKMIWKKKIPAKSGRLHESSSDVRACMCPYLAALINGVSPNLSCLLQSAPKDIKRLIVSTSFDVAARWMPVCKYIDSTKDWKHLSRRLSSTHYPHPATPFLQRAGGEIWKIKIGGRGGGGGGVKKICRNRGDLKGESLRSGFYSSYTDLNNVNYY